MIVVVFQVNLWENLTQGAIIEVDRNCLIFGSETKHNCKTCSFQRRKQVYITRALRLLDHHLESYLSLHPEESSIHLTASTECQSGHQSSQPTQTHNSTVKKNHLQPSQVRNSINLFLPSLGLTPLRLRFQLVTGYKQRDIVWCQLKSKASKPYQKTTVLSAERMLLPRNNKTECVLLLMDQDRWWTSSSIIGPLANLNCQYSAHKSYTESYLWLKAWWKWATCQAQHTWIIIWTTSLECRNEIWSPSHTGQDNHEIQPNM